MPIKSLIILFSLVLSLSFGARTGGHILGAKATWYALDWACTSANIGEPYKTIIKYIGTAESHRVLDRAVNETGSGPFTIDIEGTSYLIGFFLTPDAEKIDYLQYATLGIAYDIWDKGTGRHDFHNYDGPLIFDYNSANQELAERLCLLALTVKITF